MSEPRPLAVVGPTASGKTALSLHLARLLGGEVISMDSRQVYTGMDIGTAKATPAQRALAPHFGLDLVEPSEKFSAGRFARAAREWIAEITARGHTPILVGGTGFFLRALTHPIFREPELEPERRASLLAYLEEKPEEELHAWLRALDAATADRLSGWGGRQRLIRALELPLLSGRPLSWWHRHAPPEAPPVRPRVFALQLPRERLNAAIDRRVEEMVDAGLLEEVQELLDAGFSELDPGMSATGYAEVIPALRGEVPVAAALEAVRRNTRAYAKRQMTWFRHQLPPDAVWLDAARPPEALAAEIVESLQ